MTKAVPASFQREKDAIVLLWPIPRGEEPDPKLKVPLNPPPISQYPLPVLEREPRAREEADSSDAEAEKNLAAFGSSEFAKVVLGSFWGTPPALDLDAEASLHNLLAVLAWRRLIRSARDVSDGGIAVAVAQAAFSKGIGATVEQDASLLAHPLFGLFAEPASTVLLTAAPGDLAEIDAMANEYNFFSARIGTTGGKLLEVLVDGETFISAPLEELRTLWASALEASLHDEVMA